MTIRDELARLIAEGKRIDAYAYDTIDVILARYDLVPKGSVVVPAEPTEKMLAAPAGDYIQLGNTPSASWDAPELKKVRAMIYRAMLAARPGASHD